MEEVYRKIGETTMLVSESMQRINDFAKGFGEHLVELFKPAFEALLKLDLPERIENTADAVGEYKRILLMFGYPPHPSIGLVEINKIASYEHKKDKQKLSKYVRRIILNSFNDDEIKEILQQWSKNKQIANRITILEEGVECHLEGKYYASISTLLPQLEGLIVQKFNHRNKLDQQQLKSYVIRLLDETGRFSFDDAIKLFYLRILLDRFEHGREINSPLSRHAILHGADTKFGYKVNSIRCILIIDYLLHKFD